MINYTYRTIIEIEVCEHDTANGFVGWYHFHFENKDKVSIETEQLTNKERAGRTITRRKTK